MGQGDKRDSIKPMKYQPKRVNLQTSIFATQMSFSAVNWFCPARVFSWVSRKILFVWYTLVKP